MKQIPRAIIAASLASGILSGHPAFSLDGNEDNADQFPFVVQVIAELGPGLVGECSGVAVSKTIVISAAHCVENSNDFTIRTMINGRIRQSVKVASVDADKHMNDNWHSYYGTDDYKFLDLVVLELNEPLQIKVFPKLLNTYIDGDFQQSLLNTSSMNWKILSVILKREFVQYPGSDAVALTLVGFGHPDGFGRRRSATAALPRVSFCQSNGRQDFGGDMWCYYKVGNHYRGDSGGPLLFHDHAGNPVLAGVVSNGLRATSLLPHSRLLKKHGLF